ncbi:MAG: hypothetical protein NTZ33_16260 [Bacteroidetes bacterium]|nr:hypothetical protein [Bacteroidota bacterium]
MELSERIFWDINVSEIDFDKNPEFIIERVVLYGSMDDWRYILQKFGKEKLKSYVLNIKTLDCKTLSFLSSYFDIPKEKFKCFAQNPLTSGHWIS